MLPTPVLKEERMSDEREKRLEQDDQELDDTEVEAHKHAVPAADESDEDSFDDVEAHSKRLGPKHDLP